MTTFSSFTGNEKLRFQINIPCHFNELSNMLLKHFFGKLRAVKLLQ